MPSNSHRSNDVANMPIFPEEAIDPELYDNQGSSHMLDSIPGSNALRALQGYGSASNAGAMQNLWQFDNQNTSGFEPSTPRHSFPVDIFSTPKDASASDPVAFGNLNLNSVDEEDEFLYGDSNSLPEEPVPLKEDNVETSLNKPNSGWSDEDDFYVESVIPKKSTNAGVKQNPFAWNARNEKTDALRIPPKKLGEEKSSTSAGRNVYVESSLDSEFLLSSTQRLVSAPKGDDLKLQVSITNTNEISRSADKPAEVSNTGSKSKYHAAAELLRKQTIEKSLKSKPELLKSNVLSVERPDSSPGTSKQISNIELSNKRTVILPKNSKKFSLDKSTSNADAKALNTGDLRRPAKHFFQSDFDNITDYLPEESKKRPPSPREYAHELKSYQSFKDVSPSRNPFDSPNLSRHRSRSPVFGSPRYAKPRSRSPSFGSHSRHRSRSPSFGSHSRHRSPYSSRNRSPGYRSRYKSPVSRHRSPNQYSYKRHSRSPIRKSLEKSPGYYKHSRSRDRSRSPGLYHKSRDHSPRSKYAKTGKTKRITQKSSVKDKKSRGSSNDSFCSLSFDSRSISSDSLSEGNLVEKKKGLKNVKRSKEDLRYKLKAMSKKSQNFTTDKPPLKSANIVLSKSENIPENIKIPAPEETGNDLFKNLNEEEKKMLSMFNQLENMNFITELMRTQQANPNLDEAAPIPTVVDSFPNIADGSNMFNMPNEHNLSMPYPQMFPFNPVPLSFPPGNSYPPMIPPSVLPPSVEPYPYPEVNTLPVNIYPPITDEVNQTKKISSRPSTCRRPPTLRTIAVSESTTYPVENKDPQIMTKPSSSESKVNEEIVEPVIERTAPAKIVKADSNVEKLTAAEVRHKEKKSALIESYKKLKAKRHFSHVKVNRVVSALIEMRNLIDETWAKKNINFSEKAIYGKCKSVLSTSTDTMNKYIKEAKRYDEELSTFKNKLPAELQLEVAKLKTEDYLKEPETSSAENFALFDPGQHSCYSCNKQFPTVSAMMDHLLSSEHKENTDTKENEWIEEFRRKAKNEKDVPQDAPLQPISGIEFMKPNTGFFCTLCKEYCLDILDAEIHLKDKSHLIKFKNYQKENPLYESKCLVKRLVKYSVSTKEKRKKEIAQMEEKTAKKKKANDTADEKVKEMLKDQKKKEQNIEELEEADCNSVESKNKVSGIRLNLSGDKDLSKSSENKKSSKDTKQRVVYIGKAPNYKGRPKPWYKRDTFSDKQEPDDAASSSDSFLKQLKERISAKPLKQNLPENKSSSSKQPHSTKELPTVSSSKAGSSKSATLTTSQSDIKSLKSRSESSNTYLTKDESGTKKMDKDDNKNKGFDGSIYKSTPKSSSETSKNVRLDYDRKGSSAPLNVAKNSQSSETKTIHSDTKNVTKSLQGFKKFGPENDSKSPRPDNAKDLHTKSPEAKNVTSTSQSGDSRKKNPAVNQAIQNILHGTNSSAPSHISLTEIKLPQSPTVTKTPIKSPVSNKCMNQPIPMDISPPHTNEPIDPARPKTEEEKDFFILGINKDDMAPLAIPVPPPMSNMTYYPTPSNVAHSVLPNYIRSTPPPGYDRNTSNLSFIPTNIPPPGYNVNAMNVPSKTTAMQLSPNYIPTNIPPPGYNINASNIPTIAPGVLHPTSPTFPAMQNSPSFPPSVSKPETSKMRKEPYIAEKFTKINTKNTNLITISPTASTTSPNNGKLLIEMKQKIAAMKSKYHLDNTIKSPASQENKQSKVKDSTTLAVSSNIKSKSEIPVKQSVISAEKKFEHTNSKSVAEKKTGPPHINVQLAKPGAQIHVSSQLVKDAPTAGSGKVFEKKSGPSQNTGAILMVKADDITEKDVDKPQNEDISMSKATDISQKAVEGLQKASDILKSENGDITGKNTDIPQNDVLIPEVTNITGKVIEDLQKAGDISVSESSDINRNDTDKPQNTKDVLMPESIDITQKIIEEPKKNGDISVSKQRDTDVHLNVKDVFIPGTNDITQTTMERQTSGDISISENNDINGKDADKSQNAKDVFMTEATDITQKIIQEQQNTGDISITENRDGDVSQNVKDVFMHNTNDITQTIVESQKVSDISISENDISEKVADKPQNTKNILMSEAIDIIGKDVVKTQNANDVLMPLADDNTEKVVQQPQNVDISIPENSDNFGKKIEISQNGDFQNSEFIRPMSATSENNKSECGTEEIKIKEAEKIIKKSQSSQDIYAFKDDIKVSEEGKSCKFKCDLEKEIKETKDDEMCIITSVCRDKGSGEESCVEESLEPQERISLSDSGFKSERAKRNIENETLESKVIKLSELGEITTSKNEDKSPKESASKELLVDTNKDMSCVNQITSNDSNDNAESVFNYQAFEKLAALTQNPLVSVSENLYTVEDESKNSDTNQSAPPILELENFKNVEITNNRGQENNGSESSAKSSSNDNFDLSQSAPPVLELEIFKNVNKSHGKGKISTDRLLKSTVDFSISGDQSPVLNVPVELESSIDSEAACQTLELPETSKTKKSGVSDSDVENMTGTTSHIEQMAGATVEQYSNRHESLNTLIKEEPMDTSESVMVDQGESMETYEEEKQVLYPENISYTSTGLKSSKFEEKEDENSDCMILEEDNSDDCIILDNENSDCIILDNENAECIIMEDKKYGVKIKDEEAEENTSKKTIKPQLQGNGMQDSEDKSTFSVEPKCDDGDGANSGSETDEYDNEDI